VCGGSCYKVKTVIKVVAAKSGARSAITVETTDRPGLLVDIVRTLKDLSLNGGALLHHTL
jgi:UTP:GlnB (protein PII) uridylyltransferase